MSKIKKLHTTSSIVSKIIYIDEDKRISIDVNGVLHEFDWKLITDIFNNHEFAFVAMRSNVTIDDEPIEIRYYPVFVNASVANFASPHNPSNFTQAHFVRITSSGTVKTYTKTYAFASDVPSLAENFLLTAANRTKVPSAYMVAEELKKVGPTIVNFYWRTDIETYSGDLVNGYLCDSDEQYIVERLNKGSTVVGRFYNEGEEFLFDEPAMLQSGRYTGNSDASQEINFVNSGLSHAVGDHGAICSDNDGIIVWEK